MALIVLSGPLAGSAVLAASDSNKSTGGENIDGTRIAQGGGAPFQLRAERNEAGAPATAPKLRLPRSVSLPPRTAPPLTSSLSGGVSDTSTSLFNPGQLGAFATQNARPPLQGSAQSSGGLNGPMKAALDSAAPMKGKVSSSAPLKGAAAIKVLADYDVELIVDQSMSMRRGDCPGGLSRWSWCGMQASEMAQELSKLVKGGVTLTTFSHDYQVYPNASPSNLSSLFNNPFFGSGTRLSRPLKDRLGNYFSSRRPNSKPKLIAVITDGVPVPRAEPIHVTETLIAASHRLNNPNELTIVFFQVGSRSWAGKMFLYGVDNNLVRLGAKYDYISTVGFDELQRTGLANALANSVHRFNDKK